MEIEDKEVTIIYQSLNSNVSTNQSVKNATGQQFTIATKNKLNEGSSPKHYYSFGGTHESLKVEGPFNRIPIDSSSNDTIHENNLENSIVQSMFNAALTFCRKYDIKDISCLTLGEINGNTPPFNEWEPMGLPFCHGVGTKQCQSFAIYSKYSAIHLDDDVGYIVMFVKDLIVMFVHVPNDIAQKKSEAKEFYQDVLDLIHKEMKRPVDLIIGDTNQPSINFTPNLFHDDYILLTNEKAIAPLNTDYRTLGTNSAQSKHFDIALAHKDLNYEITTAFIPQLAQDGNFATTFTDHMGLILKARPK